MVSTQTFTKLVALWNKQNKSPNVAQSIKSAFNCLLVTPVPKRWNSMYDSVSKVCEILSDPESESKLDTIFDEVGIQRLLPNQHFF